MGPQNRRVTQTDDATEIVLDFGPHGTAACNLEIGADGAWSRVRHPLTVTKPFYSGVQFVTVALRHALVRCPHLVKFNGLDSILALGGGNVHMAHRWPQDSIQMHEGVSTTVKDWTVMVGLRDKTAAGARGTLLNDGELLARGRRRCETRSQRSATRRPGTTLAPRSTLSRCTCSPSATAGTAVPASR